MKKSVKMVLAALAAGVLLTGCSPALVEGSLATYVGVVTDRAMADVNYGSWPGRSLPYLGLCCEDGSLLCVWGESPGGIGPGDRVEVTCAEEEGTGLLRIVEIREVSP